MSLGEREFEGVTTPAFRKILIIHQGLSLPFGPEVVDDGIVVGS